MRSRTTNNFQRGPQPKKNRQLDNSLPISRACTKQPIKLSKKQTFTCQHNITGETNRHIFNPCSTKNTSQSDFREEADILDIPRTTYLNEIHSRFGPIKALCSRANNRTRHKTRFHKYSYTKPVCKHTRPR